MYLHRLVFFFFKQKTAYEMRISDWSSDVCSSDLGAPRIEFNHAKALGVLDPVAEDRGAAGCLHRALELLGEALAMEVDLTSVVSGKSVSVRVDLGGRRIIKKKTTQTAHTYILLRSYLYISVYLLCRANFNM